MFKTLFDVIKSAVVLLLLIAGMMTLPFFIVACVVLLVGYGLFVAIHESRLKKERMNEANKNKAKTTATE
jgi:ABC-type bacteriocin/lantibiotic exporter with double-glycine peptidase domain